MQCLLLCYYVHMLFGIFHIHSHSGVHIKTLNMVKRKKENYLLNDKKLVFLTLIQDNNLCS